MGKLLLRVTLIIPCSVTLDLLALTGYNVRRCTSTRTAPQIVCSDALSHQVQNSINRVRSLEAWLCDEDAQKLWLEEQSLNLGERLNNEDDIICINSFFPNEVAEGALAVLEQLPLEFWEVSNDTIGDHLAHHRFSSLDLEDIPELAPLQNLFQHIVAKFSGEAALPIFSIGRYCRGDFIDQHDDIDNDNIFLRTVAGIWYLTKDWSKTDGGCLMDLEVQPGSTKGVIVPTFNTLVIFKVPHLHAVAPVVSERIRYSIFGWWHEKGIQRLIKVMHEGNEDDQEEAAGALCCLAEDHSNGDVIRGHGGIEALVKLLHEGSMTAKANAASALGILAEDGDNKVAIRKAGGIKPLLALLSKGSEEAQAEAQDALAMLEKTA